MFVYVRLLKYIKLRYKLGYKQLYSRCNWLKILRLQQFIIEISAIAFEIGFRSVNNLNILIVPALCSTRNNILQKQTSSSFRGAAPQIWNCQLKNEIFGWFFYRPSCNLGPPENSFFEWQFQISDAFSRSIKNNLHLLQKLAGLVKEKLFLNAAR